MLSPRPPKPFKIGVIGGSISWGQYTSKRGETDWFALVSKWMFSAFPNANITARNGCTPGVPSPYMIMCLELSVDPDVDLVFMEYTLNDGLDDRVLRNRVVMDTERLVRRILALPSRPAVVLMHVPTFGMASYPMGHPKNPDNDAYRSFYETSEDVQVSICQYYDVQYTSLRTAMYRLATTNAPGFLWEDVFVDHHPGDRGHKIMADLVVYMMQQVALGLLLHPLSKADAAVLAEPLPEPMYPGNVPPSSTMCVAGEPFRSLVVAAEGFTWVNEGTPLKPKPGFVATSPGSTLRIRVDTDRGGGAAGGAAGDARPLPVFLHYMRSYERMGTAKVTCVSGCQCDPVMVDAHHTERVTQVYLAQLVVSQHRECELQVKVESGTMSGQHKFKVSGIVVAERPDTQYMGLEGNREFGIQQHNNDDRQVLLTREGRSGGFDHHQQLEEEAKRMREQQAQAARAAATGGNASAAAVTPRRRTV